MDGQRVLGWVSLALTAALAAPSGYAGPTTIAIDTLLTNASFESPGSGCPTGWTCNNAGSYAPTSAQYSPGADGLPNNLIVPNGNDVAYIPLGLSGSGTLMQNTTTNWTNGDTYTITFWLGVPKTEPEEAPSSPALPAVRCASIRSRRRAGRIDRLRPHRSGGGELGAGHGHRDRCRGDELRGERPSHRPGILRLRDQQPGHQYRLRHLEPGYPDYRQPRARAFHARSPRARPGGIGPGPPPLSSPLRIGGVAARAC